LLTFPCLDRLDELVEEGRVALEVPESLREGGREEGREGRRKVKYSKRETIVFQQKEGGREGGRKGGRDEREEVPCSWLPESPQKRSRASWAAPLHGHGGRC